MTYFVREDTEADRQAKLDAKREGLWGNHPELIINEAGGADFLLVEYMNVLNPDWLNKRLNDACDRLAAKN